MQKYFYSVRTYSVRISWISKFFQFLGKDWFLCFLSSKISRCFLYMLQYCSLILNLPHTLIFVSPTTIPSQCLCLSDGAIILSKLLQSPCHVYCRIDIVNISWHDITVHEPYISEWRKFPKISCQLLYTTPVILILYAGTVCRKDREELVFYQSDRGE